jgi:hypothetical protein
MSLQPGALKTILKIGFVAGTLDGLAAVLMYSIPTGKDPMNVFRFIASGVFGKEAFGGGVQMAIWGILFHFIIATGWSALFFVAYSRVTLLSKNKFIVAAAYGIFVWLMMNLIVVPLSGVPAGGPKEMISILKGVTVLMLCIGLPVTLMTSRFHSSQI